MFLAITEKEMTVFGITLPERCVLILSAGLLTACTQDKITGQIAQRVINPNLFEKTRDEFIAEVNKKNEFIGEPREFFIDKNAPVVDAENAFYDITKEE
jgi:hypothetical protein